MSDASFPQLVCDWRPCRDHGKHRQTISENHLGASLVYASGSQEMMEAHTLSSAGVGVGEWIRGVRDLLMFVVGRVIAFLFW